MVQQGAKVPLPAGRGLRQFLRRHRAYGFARVVDAVPQEAAQMGGTGDVSGHEFSARSAANRLGTSKAAKTAGST